MKLGTSLVVHWLRLCVPNTKDEDLIPGWETKISHATWCGPKKKKTSQTSYGDNSIHLGSGALSNSSKIL